MRRALIMVIMCLLVGCESAEKPVESVPLPPVSRNLSTEPTPVKYVTLRQWHPNNDADGLGLDILLDSVPEEAELIKLIRKLRAGYDPVIIRVWTSRIAYEDDDAKTPQFESDYILFYVKNKSGRGAYRGFDEIRWMQEVGKFSHRVGQKTRF